MPLLDTRQTNNTLVTKFISDLVLQILSFVAQNERENIKVRQKEGISSAKERGVKFGRPRKKYNKKFLKIAKDFCDKKISANTASRILNLSKHNFYYHIRMIKYRMVEFIDK